MAKYYTGTVYETLLEADLLKDKELYPKDIKDFKRIFDLNNI